MKILLAVDGSAQAEAATRFLSHFPLPRPIAIEVITVVNPPDVVVTARSDMWYPQFLEHQEQIATTTLHRAMELLQQSSAVLNDSDALDDEAVTVTTKRTMGHIGNRIIERASEGGFDLIVVAAKGHSAFERVLLGSVSDYVATHAECSVLVVRWPVDVTAGDVTAGDASGRGLSGESEPGPRLKNIVVAVDEREISARMVDHLCRYPFTSEHRFRVVTASVKLEVFREDILASTMEEAARRRTDAKQIADAAAERLRHCDGQTCDLPVESESIEAEHVGDALVGYAEHHAADLVVMGDSQRGMIARFLLGSTSRYVLRHVLCSVLIVRTASS